MIKGSCCCGAVKYELSEPPTMLGTCHCTRCRKVGASAIAFVKKETLNLLQGRDQIQTFAPEEPYKYNRCFCKKCGTSLGEILSEENSFPIAANTLDDDIDLKNAFHEFVSEKPGWFVIGDDAKQFDGHPVQE